MARACLCLAAAAFLLCGCSSTGGDQQGLALKPNMQFSRGVVFNYKSRAMAQIQPGLAVSAGAQPSSCALCR